MTRSTPLFQTSDQRWTAVIERNPLADGAFVFAVTSTGVFCRPACAARRPLRANVRFFSSGTDARTAGFRACKRCRPEGQTFDDEALALVERACRTIDAALAAPTLGELASAAGKSPYYFQRVFKRIVGISPRDYARARRDEQFRSALPQSVRVTDAIYDAGFASSSGAYALAPAALGMTPSASRDRGRGHIVRYTIVQTALGWIAVALTERGVAAIEIADGCQSARDLITTRFAHADLVHDDAALHQTVGAIVRYIERPSAGLRLPLDVQGTAFARRVWQALIGIAPGETATYAQVAAAVGRPGAARAVAAACAANPVALAVPCHRVVPKAGGTGGYRWGAARKRALLAGEKL